MIFQKTCTFTYSHFCDLKLCLSARTLCGFVLYLLTNIRLQFPFIIDINIQNEAGRGKCHNEWETKANKLEKANQSLRLGIMQKDFWSLGSIPPFFPIKSGTDIETDGAGGRGIKVFDLLLINPGCECATTWMGYEPPFLNRPTRLPSYWQSKKTADCPQREKLLTAWQRAH